MNQVDQTQTVTVPVPPQVIVPYLVPAPVREWVPSIPPGFPAPGLGPTHSPEDETNIDEMIGGYMPTISRIPTQEDAAQEKYNDEFFRQMQEEQEQKDREYYSPVAVEQRSHVFRGINQYPTSPPEEENILGDGWLRKGDLATLISTAGAGKSVAMIQAAIAWGLGLPYFGIRPPRPLRILFFSGEDDGTSIGQCREGLLENSEAITGRKLTCDDLLPLNDRLRISFNRSRVGDDFIKEMNKLLELVPADLVMMNPLLSYIGGEIVSTAGEWLRKDLLPSFLYRGCAGLVAHHTLKLAKDGWDAIDDTYSAIGGSEMANIPRSILTLRPTDAEGLSVLTVSKRKTTGWKDSNNNDSSRYFIKRTSNPLRPAWLPVSSDEAAGLIAAAKPAKVTEKGRR
jgi:hypothetical protein